MQGHTYLKCINYYDDISDVTRLASGETGEDKETLRHDVTGPRYDSGISQKCTFMKIVINGNKALRQ
jgi:hypothetical protein